MAAATRSANRSWAARLAADAAVVTCIGRPKVWPATASVMSSLGRQLPPNPKLGCMYVRPIRGSAPIPASTSSTSAPASSHSEAISLVNDSLRARNALAPFLMISAASTSTTRRGASIVS